MNTEEETLIWSELPLRAVNALERAGITTLSQLAPLSRSELLGIRGIGEAAAYEVSRIVGSAVDVAVAEERCSAGHHAS